jgi:2-oxoglutarate ferredoxin oxidoreductase subunit alpha
LLEQLGVRAGLFRPITLWPFPEKAVLSAASEADLVICAELAMGQLLEDVRLSVGSREVKLLNWLGGVVPTPEDIVDLVVKEMRARGGTS